MASTGADIRSLEGHIACGTGLYVTVECLGRSYYSKSESHDLSITLPHYDFDVPLAPPVWECSALTPDDKEEQELSLKWGVIKDWDTTTDGRQVPTTARVDRWRFETIIQVPQGESFSQAAWSVMPEVDDWWALFRSWLEILTSRNIATRPTAGDIRSEPIWIWECSAAKTRRNPGVARSWPLYDHVWPPIDDPTLEACMKLAALREPPPDMWLFIRDARALIDSGDYRRAVIDAGTAAELAMTEILDQDLAATGSVLREALLARSRTLEGRAKLMKDLGAGCVPTTFKADLQNPRNKAAHGGVRQTLNGARKALAIAIDLVEQAEPLLGLVPE